MAPACIIDAPQTGQHVKIEPLSSHSYYAGCQALPVTDPARDHRGEVERPRARHTPSPTDPGRTPEHGGQSLGASARESFGPTKVVPRPPFGGVPGPCHR